MLVNLAQLYARKASRLLAKGKRRGGGKGARGGRRGGEEGKEGGRGRARMKTKGGREEKLDKVKSKHACNETRKHNWCVFKAKVCVLDCFLRCDV